MREGLPLPQRIQNAPELDLGLQFFFNAWSELGRDRPVGFGPGPIPLSSMYLYAAYHELDEEQVEDLIYFIGAMDTVFLKWAKEKGKGNGKS